ncbi:MAG: hypothetical protein JSU74_01805 [Candidatus Zixiibacteriota bacterium]|nr:MAG: hypothetical protein JSU74_01805 [candidate division Zixibacteria bacterium]
MISFLADIWRAFSSHRKGLLIFAGICVIVLVAGGLVLKFQATRSSFCDSCHYMDPYVRHWQASSHAGVDCVSCHDYGSFDLAVSAVKYWFDAYESRPKAVVPDENCLSSDCHDHQALDQDREFTRGIIFKHAVHLEHDLRGGQLRCTSCHNQIVQYEDDIQGHMVVNDKSCFVCHFKDAGMGEAITGCDACHGMPEKTVEHAGFQFDHEPYLKLEVECKQCHVRIVTGNGAVTESKCYTCHVERLKEQYSRSQLHDIHVTEQGIDCYRCHSDIEHGNFSMTSALDIECESCHLRQHSLPKQLYMGIGGADTLDMPSDMFTAQVSCSGCHTHITPEGVPLAHQEKKEASRQSCVTCHGEGYDLMLDNWLEGSREVQADYLAFLKTARADYNSSGGSRKSRAQAKAALINAEKNYNFVREGHIPHNIQYSLHLLNVSADNFVQAMRAINGSYQAPDRGDGLKSENSCLTFCHKLTFNPDVVSYGKGELPHQVHVTEFGLGCGNCHSVTEHGKTRIEQTACADCHE